MAGRHRLSVCVQVGRAALWQGKERRSERADDVPWWYELSVLMSSVVFKLRTA